jgi:hypothetical protein
MVAMLTDFGDNSDVTQLLRALQTTLRCVIFHVLNYEAA